MILYTTARHRSTSWGSTGTETGLPPTAAVMSGRANCNWYRTQGHRHDFWSGVPVSSPHILTAHPLPFIPFFSCPSPTISSILFLCLSTSATRFLLPSLLKRGPGADGEYLLNYTGNFSAFWKTLHCIPFKGFFVRNTDNFQR